MIRCLKSIGYVRVDPSSSLPFNIYYGIPGISETEWIVRIYRDSGVWKYDIVNDIVYMEAEYRDGGSIIYTKNATGDYTYFSDIITMMLEHKFDEVMRWLKYDKELSIKNKKKQIDKDFI